jgi:hypothetical protein
MVNPKCEHTGCTKRPSFNVRGETKGRFCKKHKTDKDMVNVKDKTCENPGCTKIPTFNVSGETKGRFCFEHITDDNMVNVKHKTCENPDCTKQPTFNVLGETKGRFCSEHKEDKMVDVVNKTCEHKDCTKQPVFNVLGETKGRFCSEHKEDKMVDVKNKTCENPGCTTQPTYNVLGETKGRFCFEHKERGMVNVKDKTCEHPTCSKQPVFNKPDETKGRFCFEHKERGMVNVKDKTCENPGCTKRPYFNVSGETKGRFCKKHITDKDMVNVVSKKCEHTGCTTFPRYNVPGQKASRCNTHKQTGMIVNPKKRCCEKKCKEYALYGTFRAEFCESHCDPATHINWMEKECVSCRLPNILNKNSRCQYCDPDMFNKTRLAKQNYVKRWLDNNGFKYDSCDTVIEHSECGKERPDFVFDCGTHVVILEVDENQHRERVEVCECTRMVNIFQSFGGLHVKFVRYNPDKYKKGGRSHDPAIGTRMNVLHTHLEYALKDEPVSFLSVKHLFYDNERETTVFNPIEIC